MNDSPRFVGTELWSCENMEVGLGSNSLSSPPPPPAVPNKLFLVPHKLYGFCGRRVPRKEKNGYKSVFARWSACMLHVGRWGGVGAGSAEPSPTHPCLVYDLFSRAGNSPHPYRLIWSHLSGAQLRPVWRHREMIR